MHDNQLPTKSPGELEDNSNVVVWCDCINVKSMQIYEFIVFLLLLWRYDLQL